MNVAPSCPTTHDFDKNNCICLAKTRKKAPCKPGKVRNENGRCVLSRKKVCPPGKVLNEKTRRCNNVPKPKVLPKTKPTKRRKSVSKSLTTVVSVPGTVAEKAKSEQIKHMVSKKYSPVQVIKTVRSFSPSINKHIVSLHKSPRVDIFHCGDGMKQYLGNSVRTNPYPRIAIGTDENGNPICEKMNTKKAREVLLHNIRNVTIDENQIITPLQKNSNCWFNTLFVTFFISDKGRKFFRYFREMMVTGKHADGKKINPRLARSFLMLNACIEASYGNQNAALAMDTNKVIWDIYRAIPISGRYKAYNGIDYIKDVKRTGNPIEYYVSIMKYIDNKDLKYDLFRKQKYVQFNIGIQVRRLSELMIFEIYDSECKGMTYADNVFAIDSSSNKKAKYKLDAAIVRDYAKRHFCALLTVNGNQYGFDGASHSRLALFDWKPHLLTESGRKKKWLFEGSYFNNDPKMPIKWSFSSAYHLLFYYRVE